MPRAQESATASDVEVLVKSALQLIVLAKRLREQVQGLKQEFANVPIDNPIVFADYNKAIKEIANDAIELRDTMVNYLIELASKVPLNKEDYINACLLYTSPSPRDRQKSRMPSSA